MRDIARFAVACLLLAFVLWIVKSGCHYMENHTPAQAVQDIRHLANDLSSQPTSQP